MLTGVLIVSLTVTSCGLMASPEGVEAVTPSASLNVTPDLFCPGEILTARYDGGPQVSSCGSDPDSQECKGASLTTVPRLPAELSFPLGFGADNLHGSVSAPADSVDNYTFTYSVEWEAWSSYRDLRVPARPDSGRTWTGRKSAIDFAYPVGIGETRLNYTELLVCDEETHTWRWGRGNDGIAAITPSGQSTLTHGIPSACAALTQVCRSESSSEYPVRIRVEGGPNVVIGGPDNPRCTDAFEGYNADDIIVEPATITDDHDGLNNSWGESCNPSLENTHPDQSFLDYYVAGSSFCAIGPEDTFPSWQLNGVGAFQFGSIPLRGPARERCLAALDPSFVAQIPLVPVDVIEGSAPPPMFPIIIGDGSDSEPGLAAICDLENSCGDAVCQTGCEDAVSCAQDCEPSDANCPPGTYFAPVTNRCIAIQISPTKDKGGSDGGGRCPAGQSWTCNTTKYPAVCSCK